jgi:hypothetical protein
VDWPAPEGRNGHDKRPLGRSVSVPVVGRPGVHVSVGQILRSGKNQRAHPTRIRAKETLKAELKASADVEIEKFKSQATVEIEKLRSQLSSAAAERHVRFSKLHDRRAEVIAELYKLLFETHAAVEHYVREDMPFGLVAELSSEERQYRADKALNSLADYFVPNRIFVHVADQIGRILRECKTGYTFGLIGHGAPTQAEKSEYFKTADAKLAQLSETALVDLEREFRTLLGDDVEKSG